jgi:demethylmenaquinone methyltransferase/2-methoxy-6-polyprenyl-1,4-benzoquinol methylase
MAETGHFGARQVPLGEKQALVDDVFHGVARRYDLMNDLMSFGLHRTWKNALVTALDPPKHAPFAVLDVAGGTGDIAERFLRRAGAGARVVVCDISERMVRRGRDRAIDVGRLAGIDWLSGNAERLPIKSASVDAYTIAFGLRNVTDISAALKEARRVLRPGGRFLCLEFSPVDTPFLRQAYDLYSFVVLPGLGQLVAGDRDAYRYLAESIRRFPRQDELARLMREAGFEQVRFRNLTGGIAALHAGWRL